MKTYLDCIPCFYRQVLEAGRSSGLDDAAIKKIIDKTGKIISRKSLSYTPPEMAGKIHKMVRKESGADDCYREIKNKSNTLALGVYDNCKQKVKKAKDPLLTAVELAIAGNIIDFGVKSNLNVEHEVENILREEKKLVKNGGASFFAYDCFKEMVGKSGTIMVLADNAGETVFDRILIEEILKRHPEIIIYYAVKKGPIINDALVSDATECGIDKIAEIITTGLMIPGTVLKKCSREFLTLYRKADMIISKGQGNFESFEDPGKAVFYLFMAKCPVVAREVGCEMYSINLHYNSFKKG
ncbi:MAG: DUF89 family protein [Spirochaetaceae bacterium]|nr:MAG: DUF89 family protein [Spirochaetaceae bacterium]